jgi:hypothetical protein
MISGPDLLLNAEQVAELGAGTPQTGIQTAEGFFLTEPVWNGHDQWL